DERIDPVILHFYGPVCGEYWPPERGHTMNAYRSLPFPFDEIEAPPLEIRESWTRAQFLGYVGTWSAVRAITKARGGGPFEEFSREIGRLWPDPSSVRTVRWPLGMRAGRVR